MGNRRNIILREIFENQMCQYPLSNYIGDFYMAIDGSYRGKTSGIGVIIQTYQGKDILEISQQGEFPDNNAAEYGALRIGLKTLFRFVDPDCKIGIITDHDQLSSNINAIRRENEIYFPGRISIPKTVKIDWREIREIVNMCHQVKSVCIKSKKNPAHRLANLVRGHTTYGYAEESIIQIPPPSRAIRRGKIRET